MSVKKTFRKTGGNRETSLPGWRGLCNDGHQQLACAPCEPRAQPVF